MFSFLVVWQLRQHLFSLYSRVSTDQWFLFEIHVLSIYLELIRDFGSLYFKCPFDFTFKKLFKSRLSQWLLLYTLPVIKFLIWKFFYLILFKSPFTYLKTEDLLEFITFSDRSYQYLLYFSVAHQVLLMFSSFFYLYRYI